MSHLIAAGRRALESALLWWANVFQSFQLLVHELKRLESVRLGFTLGRRGNNTVELASSQPLNGCDGSLSWLPEQTTQKMTRMHPGEKRASIKRQRKKALLHLKKKRTLAGQRAGKWDENWDGLGAEKQNYWGCARCAVSHVQVTDPCLQGLSQTLSVQWRHWLKIPEFKISNTSISKIDVHLDLKSYLLFSNDILKCHVIRLLKVELHFASSEYHSKRAQ